MSRAGAKMSADGAHGNILFVVLPNGETLTARRLPDHVTPDYLKARLELATGIHGNAMRLTYGGRPLDDDDDVDVDLYFGENLRSGGLVKLSVADHLLQLYFAVCAPDGESAPAGCVLPGGGGAGDSGQDSEQTNEAELSADDKFFALLLACRQGNRHVIEALLDLDPEGLWKKQCTRFRRTLAHVASASNQTRALELLLGRDAPIQTTDCFDNTPLDVAVRHGAYACERMLKQALMRKKSARGRRSERTPARKNAVAMRVCWKDECKDKTTPTTAAVARPGGAPPLDSGGVVCGTTLTSSRRTSADAYRASPRARGPAYAGKPSRSGGRPAGRPGGSPSSRCSHRRCTIRPPFMAFRTVPQEELRPVAVEYVPLPTSTSSRRRRDAAGRSSPTTSGERLRDCYPRAPCSSLNNSAEDLAIRTPPSDGELPIRTTPSDRELALQRRHEMMKRYTKTGGAATRAQSAKYYRTKYHLEAECDASIPKPRPSTAGPRYREWKTWLLDQMERDAEKAEKAKTNHEDERRRKLNELAYRKWLARHDRDRLLGRGSSESESDDGEDGADGEEAYASWLESKRAAFREMDRRRRDEILKAAGDADARHRASRDRRIAVFEIGACLDGVPEPSKPDRYIRAYQTWIRNKKNYEGWKRRNGLPVDEKTLTKEEFVRARDALLLDGMTYNEWLGLKASEQNTNKLHLHKFE